MKRFAAAACVALVFATAGGALAADPSGEPASADPEQQVLVLLRMPPPHFRPDANYASGYADAAGSSARRRIATALARNNGLSLATDWPLPVLGVDCYVMNVPPSRRVGDVVALLGEDPRVAWAEPMNVYRSLGHDDPLFGLQPSAREWNLSELHGAATGREVRVALIDSGVQLDHPDLAGQVALNANFVAERDYRAELHGTAVAGIIAARADNRAGIVGVAPDARLLALRSCWQVTLADSRCTTLGLALGLHTAIERGAQVINLSLTGPDDRLLRALVETAVGRGIGVVAAAERGTARGGFPASVIGVVAVVDEESGNAPEGMVAAPGRDIPASLPESRWAMVSGTSYAAAQVSGLLALMLDAQTRAGRPRVPIATQLVRTPDGRLDACASVARAGGAAPCKARPGDEIAAAIAPR